MPTLRSNAITHSGATMDYFSFTGIKLAEPVFQVNHGRLEVELVESNIERPDSLEGAWVKSQSDTTSHQKQSDISCVYVRIGGDEDDPSSTWADIVYDESDDPCVDVDIVPKTVIHGEIYISSNGTMNTVESSHYKIDDEDDLIIKLDATSLPLPDGYVAYEEQKKSSDVLFSLLKRIEPPGRAYPGLYNVDDALNVTVWTRSGVVKMPFLAPAGTQAGQYFF